MLLVSCDQLLAGAGAEERFVACWRTREVALQRLMQRPAEVAPSEPPPAVQGQDHSERVTETAMPPAVAAARVPAAVGVAAADGLGPDPAGTTAGTLALDEQPEDKLADDRTEAEWFEGVIEEFLAEVRDPGARGSNLEAAALCASLLALSQESSRQGGARLPVPAA